ncbi:hypothetical protein D3C73_1404660 [compost metagenome]
MMQLLAQRSRLRDGGCAVNQADDHVVEQRQKQPGGDTRQCRGRGLAETDREQNREVQPEPDIDYGNDQKDQNPPEFLRRRRIADGQKAKSGYRQPQGKYHDGNQQQ